MNEIDPDVWAKLSVSAPTGDRLSARRASPAASERLLAATDSSGQRHWLILLAADDAAFEDEQTRGLTVSTREMTLDGSPRRYIDLVCLESSGNEAFGLIGNECAAALQDSMVPPAVAIDRILSRWRRFWGQVPAQLLSVEQLLGLFGEVTFLCDWLLPVEGAGALSRWRGPFGSRHDFEWDRHSVEVKTTASGRGQIHHVNGLEQLGTPQDGSLNVFAMVVRLEGGGGDTVPSTISRVRTAIESDARALTQFETALSRVGYSPVHEQEYQKIRIRIAEQAVFEVRADFPRLIRDSIAVSALAGVERVNYEINLNSYSHLVASDVPPYPRAFLV